MDVPLSYGRARVHGLLAGRTRSHFSPLTHAVSVANEQREMLKYLWDPVNAITISEIVLSCVGLIVVVLGSLEFAVATVLWAVLADHLDGVVAMRTKNRDPSVAKMGRSDARRGRS